MCNENNVKNDADIRWINSLFRNLFSNKESGAEVCNALFSTTSYTPNRIIIPEATDLMNKFNVIAYIVDNEIILVRNHFSKLCHDLAWQMFLCYVELLQEYVDLNGGESVKSTILHPNPKFFVLYNGESGIGGEIFLSNNSKSSDFEFKVDIRVRAINVNDCLQRNMFKDSQTLAGYYHLLKLKDAYMIDETFGEVAKTRAIVSCIKGGILSDRLRELYPLVEENLERYTVSLMKTKSAKKFNDKDVDESRDNGFLNTRTKEMIYTAVTCGVSHDVITKILGVTEDEIQQAMCV